MSAITVTDGYFYKCQRCGFEWPGRKLEKPGEKGGVTHPRNCPGCKTAMWERPKTKQVKKDV